MSRNDKRMAADPRPVRLLLTALARGHAEKDWAYLGAQAAENGGAPATELEALIEEQLRLMATQIEVLRLAPTQNGGPNHE